MTNSEAAIAPPNRPDLRIAFVAVILSLLIGAFAVSDQSLWIDEAHSAAKAMQPSLGSWWTKMMLEKGSDLQMPFYMLYLWAWAKVFGASEIALRASNVPWFAAGVLALGWGFPQQRRLQFSIALLTLSSPFLWYYIDEARSYIVLFAFSALTAASLFRLRMGPAAPAESPSWFQWFSFGIVGICATNLIAVPWAMAATIAFVFWTGPRHALQVPTRSALATTLSICALIALCFYYVWSLQLGARASDVSRTGLIAIAFAFYELLGLSGLGPGRLLLREEGAQALLDYAPILSAGAIVTFILCAAGVAELRKRATLRDLIFFGSAVVFPLMVVMLAGLGAHMRLLGRHFTPLLPFLLALQGFGLQRLLSASSKWSRTLAAAAIAILLISAIEIRFAPRHWRDDYRSAVNLARAAIGAGEKVWWVADEATGVYYNLPLNSPRLVLRSNLTDNAFQTLPPPDIVCLSKPDIYDPDGKITNYIHEHDFTVKHVLPAFQIFERPADH